MWKIVFGAVIGALAFAGRERLAMAWRWWTGAPAEKAEEVSADGAETRAGDEELTPERWIEWYKALAVRNPRAARALVEQIKEELQKLARAQE